VRRALPPKSCRQRQQGIGPPHVEPSLSPCSRSAVLVSTAMVTQRNTSGETSCLLRPSTARESPTDCVQTIATQRRPKPASWLARFFCLAESRGGRGYMPYHIAYLPGDP
jgi:hypothetical protein